MTIFLWTLLACALAQDDGVDAGRRADGVYEVRVYGEDEVAAARQAALRAIEAQGWRHVGTRRGDDVFRGPSLWKGKVKLTGDGLLVFGGKPVQYGYGLVPSITANPVPPEGVRPFQALLREGEGKEPAITVKSPGRRLLGGARGKLARAVQPEVIAYRQAVQQAAFQERLSTLPDRLDALWSEGTPIDGGDETLSAPEERRAELLAYWASRTDTPQGRATCAVIELWLSEVVQASNEPVTPEEQRRANATARHGRTLDLLAGSR